MTLLNRFLKARLFLSDDDLEALTIAIEAENNKRYLKAKRLKNGQT